MKLEKEKLRREYLAKRNEMTADETLQKSSMIINKLISLNEFKNSSFIMCYMSFGSEVITEALIKYCIASCKRIAIPLVVRGAGDRELWACEIFDPPLDLAPGTYGILEPKKDRIRRVNPKEIDLVVVPGVVFDRYKQRIGYGAGYYDRFLKETGDNCSKIGVAFDFQVAERIPAESHDIPLSKIVTERRIVE